MHDSDTQFINSLVTKLDKDEDYLSSRGWVKTEHGLTYAFRHPVTSKQYRIDDALDIACQIESEKLSWFPITIHTTFPASTLEDQVKHYYVNPINKRIYLWDDVKRILTRFNGIPEYCDNLCEITAITDELLSHLDKHPDMYVKWEMRLLRGHPTYKILEVKYA